MRGPKGVTTMNRKLAVALAVMILTMIEIKYNMKFDEYTYLSLSKAIRQGEWAFVEGFINILYEGVYNED